ncbi:MAG: hypothetical protein ACI9W2_002515, partial [Gammaproteobacteria bacterium]
RVLDAQRHHNPVPGLHDGIRRRCNWPQVKFMRSES